MALERSDGHLNARLAFWPNFSFVLRRQAQRCQSGFIVAENRAARIVQAGNVFPRGSLCQGFDIGSVLLRLPGLWHDHMPVLHLGQEYGFVF